MTACLTHPLGKVFLSLSAKVRIKPSPTANNPKNMFYYIKGNVPFYLKEKYISHTKQLSRNSFRFVASALSYHLLQQPNFHCAYTMLTESFKWVPKYRSGFPARAATNQRSFLVGQKTEHTDSLAIDYYRGVETELKGEGGRLEEAKTPLSGNMS